MKTNNRTGEVWFCVFLALILFAGIAPAIFSASTVTALLQQNGSGCVTEDGDYVTEQNWVYNYYIEVPNGLARLRVQLFDADIGRRDSGGTRHHDYQAGESWNTSCRYRLYNPSGTAVATLTGNSTTGTDNAWMDLYNITSTPIARGHWRLEVSMASGVTTGDETNAYGIRADDGSESSAGTELNIYAHPFLPLGRMNSTFYPWATSGCTVDYNDFDGDATYSVSYSSRTGSVSGSFSGSANNAWANHSASMANDFYSIDSGLWTAGSTLSGTNIITFYTGNYAASDPPPTSQSQANTFRIYFPRDSGGKPSKPVVTQKLSFVSGPNPPVGGSTTRVRVEIAVINPAAQAITFSGSNLVTAYVPSTRVVYAGNTVVSQGSVVSQPAIGGTGNVTWNPGSVAAGATATFFYQVDVTPTANGQRTPLTGAPGSNGTTARYVDETGNTSQTQATYTYGPLCELAVSSGSGSTTIPTWVAISCFEACASESQPTVEWHTGGELGAVGFNLWRQDRETKEFELVNRELLPALPNAPQGGVYRLADPGAFSGEPVVYLLEEIDALGRTMSYGPFTVTFGVAAAMPEASDPGARELIGREEASNIYGYQCFPRGQTDYELDRLKVQRLERQRGVTLNASGAKERVRITVKGQGLFYVTAAQIANILGISEREAAASIGRYNLNLRSMGKEIAWLADGNGAGLFFYNEGIETVFADKNVYWLEKKHGLAMETVGGGNAGAAAASQSFKETLHLEGNRYALLIPSMDPFAELWFWDYIVGGSSAKSFSIDVPGVTGAGNAILTVFLQGSSDTTANQDHHAIVSLNGSEIGSALWDGTKAHVFEISFSASMLKEGANTITVRGALDTGAPRSIFYVESFDLSYQRYYKAVANTLICRGDGNSVVTVSGLTEPQAVVLDVSRPDRPRQLSGVAPDVSGRVTFVPQAANNNYLVSGLNASLRPISVVGDKPAKLKGDSHSAEYIVIAPEEFKDAAQELADYRQSKGLKSLVVTMEDIYEAFNDGVPSPLAVRDFLARAYNNKGGKTLKYVVLAGKGTYDYKDYLGFGDNLVPAIMAKTPDGLCAADKVFGDVNGKDGVPEIAIGRLPAVTKAELRTMIAKIKAYESGQGAWTGKALFIADNADGAGDFAQGSHELAGLATGFQAEEIYLNGLPAETRAKINASWNAGAGLVNYCGHASLFQLATENIFNAADAGSLQNGGQLPLAIMFTCVAGRFELPGFSSLGEILMTNPNGGMAAGLLPSGMELHAESMRLAEEFYKAAFGGREKSAGKALLAAMKAYMEQGGKKFLLNTCNWLGDPALGFK